MNGAAEFGSFWLGRRLSALDAACLESITRRGHRLRLYVYEAVENIPDSVETADASTIVDRDQVSRFLVDGRPNLTHFTDLFRYKMFERDPRIWVDTDVLMLDGSFDYSRNLLLARESEKGLCNAVMYIGPGQSALPELIKRTLEKRDVNLRWGETGPMLLTKLFSREEIECLSAPKNTFFPIDVNEFWKVLLPEYAAECETACSGSAAIHLWNNVVDRLGYWKDLLPPEGSFLNRRLTRDGADKFFRDVYPAPIVRQMVENWKLRQNGGALGIKQLLMQFAPSVGRTLQHYYPRLGVSARKDALPSATVSVPPS